MNLRRLHIHGAVFFLVFEFNTSYITCGLNFGAILKINNSAKTYELICGNLLRQTGQ
jgi:hypothetical protein